jgi:hypothetical protein
MPGMPFTRESTSLDVCQKDQLKARIFLMKPFPEGMKHIHQYGRSALSEAIKAKCNIIVKAILDESPELAKWPQENGRIPLHLAIEEKNSTAINLLLHSYPEGLTACDKSGKSPLMAVLSSLDNARDLLLQVANVSPFLSLKIASENAKVTEARAKKDASDSARQKSKLFRRNSNLPKRRKPKPKSPRRICKQYHCLRKQNGDLQKKRQSAEGVCLCQIARSSAVVLLLQ